MRSNTAQAVRPEADVAGQMGICSLKWTGKREEQELEEAGIVCLAKVRGNRDDLFSYNRGPFSNVPSPCIMAITNGRVLTCNGDQFWSI